MKKLEVGLKTGRILIPRQMTWLFILLCLLYILDISLKTLKRGYSHEADKFLDWVVSPVPRSALLILLHHLTLSICTYLFPLNRRKPVFSTP